MIFKKGILITTIGLWLWFVEGISKKRIYRIEYTEEGIITKFERKKRD